MNRDLIDDKTLLSFYVKDKKRVFFILLIEWLIILSTFAICTWLNHPLSYLIGICVMATRMYAFYSLTHEGCHYHLISNKKINDIIGNIFFAWPILSDIQEMRRLHFLHHKFLQTDKDPEIKHLEYKEFQFPLKKKELIYIVLKDLTGINFLVYRWKKIIQLPKIKQWDFNKTLYYLIIVGIVIYSGYFFQLLILWIIPYVTIFQLLNRIRLYYEHFNFSPLKKHKTRTLHLSQWAAAFIAPYGLGYHAEHHLYPGVPFYNLRKIHAILSKNKDYQYEVEEENSYIQMFKKFLKKDE